MIALVDAQTGNLRSVEKALRVALHRAGSDETLRVTSDAEVVRHADRVVVPGQGAFADCGRALSLRAPLGRAIVDTIESGRPYLGICLGLQILFSHSEEAPGVPGLGLLAGRVARIPDGLPDARGGRLKVPHMGWNTVAPASLSGRPHRLLGGANAALHNPAGEPVPYYFVHSYHALPEDPSLVEARCDFGDLALVAAVARRNIFAVQFHPEKSQRAGLALLSAFVSWSP